MHSWDMQRTGEHFGACNLQPKDSGSNTPRSQMHLQTRWVKEGAGNPDRPCRPANLTENPWPTHELQCAVGGMKIHKGADEAGLVAELLKIRLMISKQTYCVCSMIFSTLEIFHHVGTGRSFRGWRRRHGLNNHLISGPLQTSMCCIKHLPS